jgi:hypothetical protein
LTIPRLTRGRTSMSRRQGDVYEHAVVDGGGGRPRRDFGHERVREQETR